jgi:hypothetical protein
MKMFIMAFAAVALAGASVCALEDNKANREKEADRFLSVMTVRETCADIAEQIGKSVPADHRKAFQQRFIKHMDTAAIEKAMKASLVKNFTAEELGTLADFYAIPAGKSAMKKMAGPYMVEIMPTIQAEIRKAQTKASSELENEPKPAK